LVQAAQVSSRRDGRAQTGAERPGQRIHHPPRLAIVFDSRKVLRQQRQSIPRQLLAISAPAAAAPPKAAERLRRSAPWER